MQVAAAKRLDGSQRPLQRLSEADPESSHEMETDRIFKTCKFRLRPTDDQAARLEQWFASVRWIYNAALVQRETYG